MILNDLQFYYYYVIIENSIDKKFMPYQWWNFGMFAEPSWKIPLTCNNTTYQNIMFQDEN